MEYIFAFLGIYCQAIYMNNKNALMGSNLVNLIICYQHLANRINRNVEPLQLNMTQLSILNHFSWKPETTAHTIGKLAQIMQMNQPAITKAVKAMVENGWLRKQADSEDARVSLVFITPEGLAQLDKARMVNVSLLEATFGSLPEQELVDLNTLLEKLKVNILKY